MTTEHLQLALFAVLGGLCVWGWRVELARAKAWQVDTSGTVPPSVRRFRAVGDDEWVALGDSEEADGESLSATPTLVARGFELRDDDGHVEVVAQGTKIVIRAIDGARRAQIDTITSGGSMVRRFSFEVPPHLPLFTRAVGLRSGLLPYRSHAARGIAKKDLVLAGKPEAVAGDIFPGCWMIIFVALVGSGAIGALLHATSFAWVVFGFALALVGLAWMALPQKPPTSSEGS